MLNQEEKFEFKLYYYNFNVIKMKFLIFYVKTRKKFLTLMFKCANIYKHF